MFKHHNVARLVMLGVCRLKTEGRRCIGENSSVVNGFFVGKESNIG